MNVKKFLFNFNRSCKFPEQVCLFIWIWKIPSMFIIFEWHRLYFFVAQSVFWMSEIIAKKFFITVICVNKGFKLFKHLTLPNICSDTLAFNYFSYNIHNYIHPRSLYCPFDRKHNNRIWGNICLFQSCNLTESKKNFIVESKIMCLFGLLAFLRCTI